MLIIGLLCRLSQQMVVEAGATADVSTAELQQCSSSTAAADADGKKLVDVQMGACGKHRYRGQSTRWGPVREDTGRHTDTHTTHILL